MFHWIRTGIGQEGSPSTYMPQHAAHFLAFAILCLVSRGLLGLVLGAALLNYMNAYVVALLVHSEPPWLVAPFAWPAYAIVRVVGLVCIATALTAITLRRRTHATVGAVRIALWVGFGLVVADLALKAVLAPLYPRAVPTLDGPLNVSPNLRFEGTSVRTLSVEAASCRGSRPRWMVAASRPGWAR